METGRSPLVTLHNFESVENSPWRAGVHLPTLEAMLYSAAASEPDSTYAKVDV